MLYKPFDANYSLMHSVPSKLPHLQSQSFLELFSKSLKSSFEHFCYHEGLKKNKLAKKSLSGKVSGSSEQLKIIQISDDEEEAQTKGKIQDQKFEISIRIPKCFNQGEQGDQLKADCQKTQEAQESNVKKQSRLTEAYVSLKNSFENMVQQEIQFEYVEFEISCPQIGLKNGEFARKKRNLISRRIEKWCEVQEKGKKQKREIRMLKR